MELNGFVSDINPAIIENNLFRKASPEYLQELLQDKQKLQCFQRNFKFRHLLSILEKEINRVREKLFRVNGTSGQNKSLEISLPSPKGEYVTVNEKVYLPVDDNPNYNFIGRILGPRGLTAKQLEQELQCKIMIRGKGSLRNKEKEEELMGRPNWEHLGEKLHINIAVEDYENRAALRLSWAKRSIERFIEHGIRVPDGEDDIKKRQLMELAIINGTYRDTSKKPTTVLTNGNGVVAPLSLVPHASLGVASSATAAATSSSSAANNSSVCCNSSSSNLLSQHNQSPFMSAATCGDMNQCSTTEAALFSLMPSLQSSTTHHQQQHQQTYLAAAMAALHQQHQQQQQPSPTSGSSICDNSAFYSLLANPYRSGTGIDPVTLMPFSTSLGLYNLQDPVSAAAAAAAHGMIGPIRIRNIAGGSHLRSHPYQLM